MHLGQKISEWIRHWTRQVAPKLTFDITPVRTDMFNLLPCTWANITRIPRVKSTGHAAIVPILSSTA